MVYRRRIVDDLLDELMLQLPAVLLDGPKAVGKTSTAALRANTVKRFDRPEERMLAEANPTWITQGEKPILLDEWQRSQSVWDRVKAAVDSDFTGGQFLLTGSMPNTETHSGAGRITSIRMRPLSIAEREISPSTISLGKILDGSENIEGETSIGVNEYCKEMMLSGFPAIRTLSDKALRIALDGYIERIIDTDIKEVGLSIRKPASLRSWVTAYAAATGTTASWETIRDAANSGSNQTPAKTTAIPYRDALSRLRILDELQPWSPSRNTFAQVSKSAKHYLADPALALRLMNFDSESIQTASAFSNSNYDAPLIGRMFESLAVQSVQTYAQAAYAKAFHFRESNGRHEIDMIIEQDDGRVIAIEVKLSSTPAKSDGKNLKWLKAQIGEQMIDSVVLYAGKFAFRNDGIAYIPLAMFGP
jgi:predicted AAA+ superfamily ATPase